MELQKTRKAASEKVINAPLDKILIIEQLVEDPKDGHTPEELERIMAEFATQVAAETGVVTLTKLHELLHSAIEECKGDSFTLVDDLEGSERFAGVGVCFHGDEPETQMSDGLVHIFHESRDMFDPHDGNIYVVLDEGCNSTCHSKYWGEVVETKLKKLGYEFPFASMEPKNFAGLGEKGTAIEGSRTLAIFVAFRDRETLAWCPRVPSAFKRSFAAAFVTSCSGPSRSCQRFQTWSS